MSRSINRRKEGNVLFNDEHNTFYLWLYGVGPFRQREEGRKEVFYLTTHTTHFIYGYMDVGHMVKDHSDSERENSLPPYGLLFPSSNKGCFICSISQKG